MKQIDLDRAREINKSLAESVYGPAGAETNPCAISWDTAKHIASLESRIQALESRLIDPAVTAAIAGIDAQVREDAVRLSPEPGVVLTTSTQDAMERIATAPRTSEQGAGAAPQATVKESLMVDSTEGLVEMVADAIYRNCDGDGFRSAARAAILAIAYWLDGQFYIGSAAELRREVGE